MAKRLIWLLLAALLGAAWLLLRGDGAEDAAGSGATAAGIPAQGGGADPAAQADPTRREAPDPDRGGGTSISATDPEELRLPSFIGRVLDAAGAPAAHAEVRARGLDALAADHARDGAMPRAAVEWSARADADGRFALPETPLDGLAFELILLHPGHAPLRLANQAAWGGRTRDLGDLPLQRARRLAGRVFDAAGRPLAGATIAAIPQATVEAPVALLSQHSALPGVTARTRDDGAYTLDGLPAAVLRLRARAPDGTVIWSEPVLPPPDGGLRLDLIAAPAHALEALVGDDAGRPIPAAVVSLRFRVPDLPPADLRLEMEQADADGRARLALPREARDAEWLVSAPGHAPLRRPFTTADAAAQPVRFELAPLRPLRGVVLRPDGAAAAGATVALLPARAGDLPPALHEARATALTDAAGAFTLLPDFRAGSEALQLQAWDGMHAPAPAITIAADGAAPTLPLRLQLGAARVLAGIVLQPDGAPAAHARVAVRRVHGPRSSRVTPLTDSPRGAQIWARATADAAGGFAFRGLPEADWLIEAVLPPHSPGISEEFALTASIEDLRIQLPAACGIAGQVEAELRGLPPLVVVATARSMGWLLASVAADGRFELPALAPAEWSLSLLPAVLGGGPISGRPGGTPLARIEGVEVLPGAVTPVLLRVDAERFGRLDGQTLRRGAPFADCAVWLIPDRGEPDPLPEMAALQRIAQARRLAPDAQGRFAAGALAAGSWWVVICAPHEEPAGWRDARGRLDPRGWQRRRVEIEEGGAQRCEFDLHSGTLRIRMSEAQGQAMVRLEPHPDEAAGAPRLLRIGPEGRSEELPSGAWTWSDLARTRPPVTVHVPPEGTAEIVVPPDPAREEE